MSSSPSVTNNSTPTVVAVEFNPAEALPAKQQALLKRIKEIPALPQVVYKVIELMGQNNTPTAKIAELISYDPGLTSRLLRMINSSAYGLEKEVTSVQHSIALLGFSAVRNLVLTSSVCAVMQEKGQKKNNLQQRVNLYSFWFHSLVVALVAKEIATLYQIPKPEEIFCAASLHDIGRLALYHFAPELLRPLLNVLKQWEKMEEAAAEPLPSYQLLQLERKVLGFDHCQLGHALAQKWKLPPLMSDFILHHHTPLLAEKNQGAVLCLALANTIFDVRERKHWDNLNLSDIEPELAQAFHLESDEEFQILLTHFVGLEQEASELVQSFQSL